MKREPKYQINALSPLRPKEQSQLSQSSSSSSSNSNGSTALSPPPSPNSNNNNNTNNTNTNTNQATSPSSPSPSSPSSSNSNDNKPTSPPTANKVVATTSKSNEWGRVTYMDNTKTLSRTQSCTALGGDSSRNRASLVRNIYPYIDISCISISISLYLYLLINNHIQSILF